MHIPIDKDLTTWILELIRDNKLYKFYQTEDWQELRKEILSDQHGECQRCLAQGILTRAVLVHHVNEVRVNPSLALSKTYIDNGGKEQQQLIALCFNCHEIIHGRLNKVNATAAANKFTNVERW